MLSSKKCVLTSVFIYVVYDQKDEEQMQLLPDFFKIMDRICGSKATFPQSSVRIQKLTSKSDAIAFEDTKECHTIFKTLHKRYPSLSETLTMVDLDSSEVKSLAGIELFPKLARFHCGYFHIKSLEGLQHCPNLTSIRMRSATIESKTLEAPSEPLLKLNSLRIQRPSGKFCSIANIGAICPQLETLELNECEKITSFAGIDQLSFLTTLVAPKANITHADDLRLNVTLRDLDLSESKIENINGLADFKHLTRLRLRHTKITSIAPLKGCASLMHLDVYGCHKLASLNGCQHLLNLESLLAQSTQIESTEQLCGHPSLKSVNLSHCSKLETVAFRLMPQLATLVLSHLRIRTLDGIQQCPMLRLLNVEDCKNLPSFESLPTSLDRLDDIKANRCGVVSPKGLNRFANLRSLQLASCANLTSFDGLGSHPHLEELFAPMCFKLKDIAALRGCPKLWYLFLCDCSNLTSISGTGVLPALDYLAIFGTKIPNLEALKNFPAMKDLNLSNCRQLSSLDGIESAKFLKSLAMDNVNTTTLRPLRACKNLTYLYVSGTGVKTFLGLEGNPSLKSITSTRSQLTTLKDLHGCTSLSTLLIESSQLTNCDGLADLPNLTKVTFNQCRSLANMRGIKVCPKLEYLTFNSCRRLGSVEPGSVLPSLRRLFAGEAALTTVDALSKLCPRLETLRLPRCTQLKSIDGLANLAHLRKLNIQESAVTTLHALGSCPLLYDLNVYHCKKITSLIGLRHLQHLTVLNASSLTNVKTIKPLKDCPALRLFSMTCCDKLTSLEGLEGHQHLQRVIVDFSALPRDYPKPEGCPLLTDYRHQLPFDAKYDLKRVRSPATPTEDSSDSWETDDDDDNDDDDDDDNTRGRGVVGRGAGRPAADDNEDDDDEDDFDDDDDDYDDDDDDHYIYHGDDDDDDEEYDDDEDSDEDMPAGNDVYRNYVDNEPAPWLPKSPSLKSLPAASDAESDDSEC